MQVLPFLLAGMLLALPNGSGAGEVHFSGTSLDHIDPDTLPRLVAMVTQEGYVPPGDEVRRRKGADLLDPGVARDRRGDHVATVGVGEEPAAQP